MMAGAFTHGDGSRTLSSAEHDGGGWQLDPSGGGLFVIVAVIVGLVCRTALREVRRKFNLPYTVIVLVMGAVYAVVAHTLVNLGAISDTLGIWVHINPHHLLFLFFPALIFGFAFEISFHVFMREAPIILLLAAPGVLIATLLTGAVRAVVSVSVCALTHEFAYPGSCGGILAVSL